MNFKYSTTVIVLIAVSLISVTAMQQDAFAQITDSSILVEGSNDVIIYKITGGELLDVIPDVETNSLILLLDAPEDGILTLMIPITVMDAKYNGENADFFVLIDGEESYFDETITATHRVLVLEFFADSEEIEIFGTFVVPEFGTIAAMILAVAIISIIAVSAKSRLSIMPRY